MSATDPTAQPTADPSSQPPAQPTVPPASPHADTDTPAGSGRGGAPRRLTRSREDRILTGVCGGVATYLRADPTLVRVLVVVGTVLGGGTLAIAYVAAALLMPVEDVAPTSGGATAGADCDNTVIAPR